MDAVKHLVIKEGKFTTDHDRELGRGAFGAVCAVNYNGVTCAAKYALVGVPTRVPTRYQLEIAKKSSLRECLQHSKLHHPNIVKMLGIFYPKDASAGPIIVMELMDCNLTQLFSKNYQNIPMFVKLSIMQDVSKAICYLHILNPPLIHCDLNPDNILFTTSLVAKVCGFAVMRVVSPSSSERMFRSPEKCAWMPPEAFGDDPHYGLPYDVFSFGYVVYYMIDQQWSESLMMYCRSISCILKPKTAVSEVESHEYYIDFKSERSLRQLVLTCLDNDQERRPPMSQVSERITSIITG